MVTSAGGSRDAKEAEDVEEDKVTKREKEFLAVSATLLRVKTKKLFLKQLTEFSAPVTKSRIRLQSLRGLVTYSRSRRY